MAGIVDIDEVRFWQQAETYSVEEREGLWVVAGYSVAGEDLGAFRHPSFVDKEATVKWLADFVAEGKRAAEKVARRP